jgi:putative RNA 2'-phosphotransferase
LRVGLKAYPYNDLLDAAAMAADGFIFYRSDNGIWLTDRVPPKYLKKI